MTTEPTRLPPETQRDRQRACNIKVEASGPCAKCRTITHDLDLSFEAFLCWRKCHDAMWQEYLNAEREMEAKEE